MSTPKRGAYRETDVTVKGTSRRRGDGGRGSARALREVQQMKMATVTAAFVAVLLISSMAGAESFTLIGSGSFLLDDPTYSGQIVGEFTGTFTIEVDDTLWPGENDVDPTRFEYIWTTFFADNYDDTEDAEAWYGVFDYLTLPSTPQFVFDTSVPGGILAGDISIVIMVRDGNANQVLDDPEKYYDHQYTGTLNVNPSLATGAFVDQCGYGAVATGVFNFVDPPGVDTAQFPGFVTLEDCPPQPVESATWSAVKALYR
jgi:hypothetical protein